MQHLSVYNCFRSWYHRMHLLQEFRAAHLSLHWASTVSMHMLAGLFLPRSHTRSCLNGDHHYLQRTAKLLLKIVSAHFRTTEPYRWNITTREYPLRLQSLSSVESATWQNTGTPKAYAPKISLNHLYKYPKFDWTLCEALEHFGSNPNIAKLLCCLEMFRTCSVVALVQAFVPLRGPTPQFILTLVMASGPHGGPCPAAQTGSSGLRLWDTDRHSLHHCGP